MIPFTWLLLMSGLVIASLAVASESDTESALAILRNLYFLIGVGLIGASVILKRVTAAAQDDSGGSVKAGLANIAAHIDEIISTLEDLQTLGSRGLDQRAPRIDQLLKNQVFDIVESRESIIRSYGYGQYGAFMSDFATGERFISRSWSADIDGYEEEALAYVKKAIPFFVKAKQSLDQAHPK